MSVWKTAGKVRMTPKGVWSPQTEYEILDTVVNTDLSTYYIAKQDVPVDTLLTNTDYWEVIIDVSDLVENIEGEVEELSESAVSAKIAQSFTTAQKNTARGNIEAASTTEVNNLKAKFDDSSVISKLCAEMLTGTVQTLVEDGNGNITGIVHSEGQAVVRTDNYTVTDSTATETRTLSTGEVLTIVTNLETLATTITYTEE